MDRYLRFDPRFDKDIPQMCFERKIVNKDGNIIGFRFVDKECVHIDIPVHNIMPEMSSHTSGEMQKFLDKSISHKALVPFSYFEGFEELLIFRDSDKEDLVLRDDFSYPNGIDMASKSLDIYLPTCVIRYETEFVKALNDNVELASAIINDTSFEERFRPYHIEHMRFIETDDNTVTVWLKTYNAESFMDDKEFKKALDLFHDYTMCSDIDITFDKDLCLLKLSIGLNYSSFIVTSQTIPCNEEGYIAPDDLRFKYRIAAGLSMFYIVPDGCYSRFGFKTTYNSLSPGSSLFIKETLKRLVSINYTIVRTFQNRLYVYVGMCPQKNPSFIKIYEDYFDELLNSKTMEVFQNIEVGLVENKIKYTIYANKMVLAICRDYSVDLDFFGKASRRKTLKTIKDEFDTTFTHMSFCEWDDKNKLFHVESYIEI